MHRNWDTTPSHFIEHRGHDSTNVYAAHLFVLNEDLVRALRRVVQDGIRQLKTVEPIEPNFFWIAFDAFVQRTKRGLKFRTGIRGTQGRVQASDIST